MLSTGRGTSRDGPPPEASQSVHAEGAAPHHRSHRLMTSSLKPLMEGDEQLEQQVHAECGLFATGIGLLIYGGALAFVVISCVLLYEARDTREQCGDVMLIAMLTRLCVSAASLLLSCCVLWDGETVLRRWLNARPLEEDEEGGVCAMAFGGAGPWVAALAALLFHGGCVVALAIGVSDATRRGDACLVALSAHSFTGTYTLISFVWTWLAGDGAAALLSLVQVVGGLRLKPHGIFLS